MRYARNFNPEWGYLAPMPSFVRTARIAIVAAVIGATAGAAVVFSLVDRPAAEETLAERTMVQPVRTAATVPGVSPVAEATPVSPQAASPNVRQSNAQQPATAAVPVLVSSEVRSSSTSQRPASVAALAEVPAVTEIAPPLAAAETASAIGSAAPKKTAKKPRQIARPLQRFDQGQPLAWLRSFGTRAGNF
jgi:hypothetical protein